LGPRGSPRYSVEYDKRSYSISVISFRPKKTLTRRRGSVKGVLYAEFVGEAKGDKSRGRNSDKKGETPT